MRKMVCLLLVVVCLFGTVGVASDTGSEYISAHDAAVSALWKCGNLEVVKGVEPFDYIFVGYLSKEAVCYVNIPNADLWGEWDMSGRRFAVLLAYMVRKAGMDSLGDTWYAGYDNELMSSEEVITFILDAAIEFMNTRKNK